MKLYRTEAGTWVGTQADAKASALENGLNGKAWSEVEVPTDKPSLIAWLNREVGGRERQLATMHGVAGKLADQLAEQNEPAVIAFEVPTAENFDAVKAVEGDYGPGEFIPGPTMVEAAIAKAESGVLAGYVLEALARLGSIGAPSLFHLRAFARQHKAMKPRLDVGAVRVAALALVDMAAE